MHFFRKLFHPIFYSETPEAGGGGAAPAVQPGGQGEPAQQGGDFWSMFPGVPEEHRPTLEPHLRNTQAEITRLQQQQASMKPVLDAGYEPQQLQGLIQFDQRFQQQPLEVFLDMAKMLQDQKIINEDLDLETVRAVATGQQLPDETEMPAEGEIPPGVQAMIERLQAEIEQLKGGIQQDRTRQQEIVQDNLLKTQHNRMRQQLQEAGYDGEYLTPGRLNSFLLTHRGNVNAAIQDLKEMRMGVLQGFQPSPRPQPLETRNGGPQPPKPDVSVRDRNDPWAKARVGATNRLKRANRDTAQG
jgi:hypothetical protein